MKRALLVFVLGVIPSLGAATCPTPPTGGTVTPIGNNNADNFATTWSVHPSRTVPAGDGIALVFGGNKDCASTENGIASISDGTRNSYSDNVHVYSSAGTCTWSAYAATEVHAGANIVVTCVTANKCGYGTYAYDLHTMKGPGIAEGANRAITSYGGAFFVTSVAPLTGKDLCIAAVASGQTQSEAIGNFTTFFTNVPMVSTQYLGVGWNISSGSYVVPSASMNLTGPDVPVGTIVCWPESR